MVDLNDLCYFVQVVDHGGFAAAGRAIGVPKSKLSRRIALLEERLGVRLIQRSSRRFSVTEIGREYYQRCVAMLIEAEAAEEVIAKARAEPRGVVRISCPTALLSFQFGALIARFLAAHPAVEIHLESTNRTVDVIAEGFDIAIRVRFPPLEPSELMMRTLDESTQCLVASPALNPALSPAVRAAPDSSPMFSRMSSLISPLISPGDLKGMPSLALGPAQRDHQWCLEHDDGRTALISHHPRLVTDDLAVLREGALAGIGIVQLPTIMVWNDLQAGRLALVLPQWRPRSGLVHAVFPSRRGLLPSVRALLDFLAGECARQRQTLSREDDSNAASSGR